MPMVGFLVLVLAFIPWIFLMSPCPSLVWETTPVMSHGIKQHMLIVPTANTVGTINGNGYFYNVGFTTMSWLSVNQHHKQRENMDMDLVVT